MKRMDKIQQIIGEHLIESAKKCEIFHSNDCLLGVKIADSIPNWHNLEEDPDDLPTKDGEYLVVFKGDEETTYMVLYNSINKQWEFCNNLKPLVWMELPKFK